MTYRNALAALADPTRRSVFERLRSGPLAVGRIAAAMPVSRPAVSQHLRVLKDAGLVRERRQGARRIYEVDPAGLGSLRRGGDHFWGEGARALHQTARVVPAGEPRRSDRKKKCRNRPATFRPTRPTIPVEPGQTPPHR